MQTEDLNGGGLGPRLYTSLVTKPSFGEDVSTGLSIAENFWHRSYKKITIQMIANINLVTIRDITIHE